MCFVTLGCNDSSTPGDPLSENVLPTRRAMYVSIPEVFGDHLDRPPVKFDHDKHTAALESEGCGECHAKDNRLDLQFTFSLEGDETDSESVMNGFHDACIGCHTKLAKQGEKAGPVTCGECHVAERVHPERDYVPVMPEYYEVLRDTYHRDCLSCHCEPMKVAEEAGELDWKSFHVAQTEEIEGLWPKINFDYLLHDKHDKALMGQCDKCHYISPERAKAIKAEGREPTGQEWLLDLDENRDLTQRATAHAVCINCHLEKKAEDFKTGPIHCGECHDGAQRSVEELADVARPKCEWDDRILIQLEEGARAKAVAFDHKSHVANSRSCQECHHKTLRPCGDCHTVEGSEEGGGVTLAEAYHDVSSSYSCVGCHETEKRKPDCAGCHHVMRGGLVQSACSSCHTGSLDSLDAVAKLPALEDLIPDDVEEELVIGRLEEDYDPSTMPHRAIVQRLTDISNDSTLASHFHTNPMTICSGCHHMAPLEAKQSMPPCGTCHTSRDEHDGRSPSLLGAYHQQCLGCHQQMGGTEEEMPQSCEGCHAEKAPSKD